MKLTIKLLAVFVLLLATFSPQTSASADMVKYEGHSAWGGYWSTDASGCIRTHVEIEMGEAEINSITVYQYDQCLGYVFFEAYGNKLLSTSEVKYIGNVDSAVLTTTVTVTDFERGLSFDVFVDLTWKGTGDLAVYQNHNNYRPWPGCTMNGVGKEYYREAQVSGTVSDGTTNFTTEPFPGYLLSWKGISAESHGCE